MAQENYLISLGQDLTMEPKEFAYSRVSNKRAANLIVF